MSLHHPASYLSSRTAVIVSLVAILAGCGASSAPPAAAPPPAEVAVVTVAPQRLALATELPGRLESSRVAQVRARVPGIILKRVFTEGSTVKAGQVLFQIDPAPLKASAASAEAAVARSQANLAQATLKVQRYRPLVQSNAISKQEFDDAQTAQKQATADLAASSAARQSATLNLGYATVRAPIAGRIGRAQVTEGALVGQGEATPLATIQQVDPMYLNLTQSGSEVLRLRRELASGKLQGTGGDGARVTLVTDDGQVYPRTGRLLFSDLTVDESSGAVSLRAEFANPGGLLLPGMYVRARLDQAVNDNAITVPQQAVQRTNDGASVLLVDASNKVVTRQIKGDATQGNLAIVASGLVAGDRVIVEGLQKAKPGATVRPVAWRGGPAAVPVAPVAQVAPVAKAASDTSTVAVTTK